ncbi:MAG TPA: hypothetical protein PKK06_03150 [Phycisphaerae bacterium]|nr:hypothetical protein [Phycisphaerae bacterium]HNU44682.1 hypothetical protein [Phycisphaerae bacterium]
MPTWTERYKPAAPARVHLLLSATLWTGVGAVLAGVGALWLRGGNPRHGWWLVAVAGLLGLLKARYALRRSARRIIDRIRARGDGRCLGGFLSPGTWAFVLGMVVLGRLLRTGWLPKTVVGFLYVAVGVALLAASGFVWKAWSQRDPG